MDRSSNNSNNNSNSSGPRKRGTASLLLEKARELPVCLLPLSFNAHVEQQRKASLTALADNDNHSEAAAAATNGHELPSLFLLQHTDVTEPSASARVQLRGALESGGLRANTTLVVSGDAATHSYTNYLEQWSYRTAALHALRGGNVVYVLAPGSSSFDVRRYKMQLLEHLDSAVCEETAEALPATRVALQEVAMLAALGRTDVVQCRDAEDLYVFCSLYTTPPTVRDSAGAAGLVPLVVVEGGGPDSYLDCYERASGVAVPLAAWLTMLQRRLLCAVLVVESGTSVVTPHDGWAVPQAEVSLQQDRLLARFAQSGDDRSGLTLYYLHIEASLQAWPPSTAAEAEGEEERECLPGEGAGLQPLCAVLPTGYLYHVRTLLPHTTANTTDAGAMQPQQGHQSGGASAQGQLLVSSLLY